MTYIVYHMKGFVSINKTMYNICFFLHKEQHTSPREGFKQTEG